MKHYKRKFSQKKYEAKRKGISLDISFEEIEFPTYCPVLGIELIYKGTGKPYPLDASASFDRIDPNKGYVKGNVRVISNKANMIKSNATLEEVEAVYLDMKNGVEKHAQNLH